MTLSPSPAAPGIVHIGPGAFHRAHQAVYTQDAMAASGGDWRIEGVSLRSAGIADALNAQGGRYTLVTRGADGTDYRVIDSIARVSAAAHGVGAIEAALDRASTRIVSLTMTEKAYAASTEDGAPNAITLLTDALARRREAGGRPLTLLSCDNLADNGAVLRNAVQTCAAAKSEALAAWIGAECRFPSTMVDRITPATTPALLEEVEAAIGWADKAPVETEAFSQWVIEDAFADGRPAWRDAGALMVANVAPYEAMKLRMLNGAHSMLAYTGHLMGKTYVRDVMADEGLAALVSRHMRAAAATLEPLDGADFDDYRAALLARFRNPHIAHETYQIAMDGSQKMPQRIFAPALDAIDRDADAKPFAFAFAAWLRYLGARTDDGAAYALRDPREAELAQAPADPEGRYDAICALPGLVPPALAADQAFRAATISTLTTMTGASVAAAVLEAQNG